MEVYLQLANGGEVELKVHEPDPADGTFTVMLSEESEAWLRIVPSEGDVQPTFMDGR